MKPIQWSKLEDGDPSPFDALQQMLVRLDELEINAPALAPTAVAQRLVHIIEDFTTHLDQEQAPSLNDIEAMILRLSDPPENEFAGRG